MKKYVKIYMDYYDYVIDDVIQCEYCNKVAVDIHHIEARGIGGDPRGHKNQIENLIALCRSCHTKAETNKEFNNYLKKQNKIKFKHSY
tara:strand:- start:733 stop:996 length:264 start_codon:yes stop_codon:yes gene_type:complete